MLRGPQTLKWFADMDDLCERRCSYVCGAWNSPLGDSKRIRGQAPIIWAPVPLLVFRQEDKGTDAHNMGTSSLARLSLLSMLNHGFVIELAMRFCFLYRIHYNTNDRIYYRTHDRIHCPNCLDLPIHVSIDVCMYVCMHVCIYLSMYLCIHVSIYLCIEISMYLCIYLPMHLCIYVSM